MQPLGWYLKRVRAMSPAEILVRSARQVRMASEKLGLIGARPVPPAGPLPAQSPLPSGIPPLSEKEAAALLEAADEICRGEFEFFGQRFRFSGPPPWNVDPSTGTEAPLVFAKSLNYRDPAVVGNIKYLWELNRHLEMVPLAQAYKVSGEARYLDALRELLTSWIEQCPYPRGANWSSSLELGIRLINWHLAYGVLGGGPDSPLFEGPRGERFARDWLESVYRHTQFIMTHLSTPSSSANNHLIGELAGAFVATCTWPCWPAMRRWREKTYRLLCREIERQTHPDGVNKEQTLWYQQFVIFFFVIAGLAGERSGLRFPATYWNKVADMVAFLSSVMDVAGNVPMIGDADDGLVFALEPKARLEPFFSTLAVGAQLFDVPRWREQSAGHDQTARWLCRDLSALDHAYQGAARRVFPDGGYYLMGHGLGGPDEVRLLIDAGPLGYLGIAAHGHADCLSVILSVAGRELLVDPGTYVYHADPAWRDYFRGTAAHNTARVDGLDQSEIGGTFQWLRKAEAAVEAWDSTDEFDYLRARHSGYTRFADPVTHVREVRFDKQSRSIDVTDHIRCRSDHVVERFWHFSDSCDVRIDGRGIVARTGGVSLRLEAMETSAEPVLLRGGEDPIAGWISRRFHEKAPSPTVCYTDRIIGPQTLRTRLLIEMLED